MTQPARHTPGPWFYNYDDYCIVNQAGVSVVNVHGAMGGYDPNADIALIAAAPAMYEALQEALKCIEKHVPKTEFAPRQRIREVLAQAEGRQG